jgi:hypothetical protein
MPFTIDTSYTLAEVLKSYDPEGKLHHIIDVFSSKRPILEEGYWVNANNDNSHEMLRLSKKPSGAFTRINQGYDREGVATVPVTEPLAMIGSLFELDKRLADKQSNPGAWRAQRAKLHVQGMIENWNKKFWNGNMATDVKEVNGLLTRYTPVSAAAKTANMIDCTAFKGASGQEYYPVVIVSWGEDGVQLINPKDGKKTFWEDDRGLVDLMDSDNKPFPGFRSYFNFQYGIGVGDERRIQRLFNVDANNILIKNTVPASWFEDVLIEAINKMPSTENCAIYCGRQVMTGVMQRLNSKSNVYFTPENVWGRTMPTLWGIPIIRDDSLSVVESLIE